VQVASCGIFSCKVFADRSISCRDEQAKGVLNECMSLEASTGTLVQVRHGAPSGRGVCSRKELMSCRKSSMGKVAVKPTGSDRYA
jgi:hypothetical protein